MTAVAEVLAALTAEELCTTLDVQLAELLVRRAQLEGESAMAIALATVCVSRARREGHSALSLTQLQQQLPSATVPATVSTAVPAAVPAAFQQASTSWWANALAASGAVADGNAAGNSTDSTSASQPLVLHNNVLQFSRYFEAERRIAQRVSAMAAHASTSANGAAGIPAFSIVTGGPGTGKTTFVARQLLELQRDAPQLRVALAAPTGKAAARLTESIAQRLAVVAAELQAAAPEQRTSDARPPDARTPDTHETPTPPAEARTIHRLLGYSPHTDRYRYNADNPLSDDLVIVDEASMVDVLMLDALLDALKPSARLMLVGDHQQLASVDAGDALGALCTHALGLPDDAPLHRAVTVLSTSWRFVAQPAIGTLAAGILAGNSEAVLSLASDASTPDVHRLDVGDRFDALIAPLSDRLVAAMEADTPEAMLGALEAFRVLAPEREGRWGVDGINHAIERWLSRQDYAVHEPWYHGRPVLVTANDYGLDLFNGDVGVVWRDAHGVQVYFREVAGTIRGLAPTRLPATETAWAMTVHKAQGSEFDDVLVVVPERESRVMGRELLYTAVTRARQRVLIAGSEAAVTSAVSRQAERTSGLPSQLAETH